MNNRLTDLYEEARVRWIMLDAQQKQLLLVGAFYVMLYALDIGTQVLKNRIRVKA